MKQQIKLCPPVYFALVMATGIVSIACLQSGLTMVATSLFYLNHLNYAALLVILLLRLYWYPHEVMADLADSGKGPTFLTFAAGSGMLGVQYCLIAQAFLPAMFLWIAAFCDWLFISYGFLFFRITQAAKPDPEHGLNGGWLLIVVATQSLVILGSQLVAQLSWPATVSIFLLLAFHVLGLFFYLVLVTMIFFRLTFDSLKPQAFRPPYWVLMGAAAISGLAGASLVQSVTKAGVYSDWLPVLRLLSLWCWIIAAWWIPLLTLVEIWRHFIKKVPFSYQPANWDTVFTLGMFAVCNSRLSQVFSVSLLAMIANLFLYVSLLVWAVTFFSMVRKWFSDKQ